MVKFKNKYRIESIRLPGYDYSQRGFYFITIVTRNREELLGTIINGKMELNDSGKIAQQCWLDIPNHFPHAELDEFIIMPNHLHGIIILNDISTETDVETKNFSSLQYKTKMGGVETKNISSQQYQIKPEVETKNFSSLQIPQQYKTAFKSPSKTIGSIIRGFKIGVTKWLHINTDIFIIWQRNYYEHIICNDEELNRIREYIIDNPKNWENDEENKKMETDIKKL